MRVYSLCKSSYERIFPMWIIIWEYISYVNHHMRGYFLCKSSYESILRFWGELWTRSHEEWPRCIPHEASNHRSVTLVSRGSCKFTEGMTFWRSFFHSLRFSPLSSEPKVLHSQFGFRPYIRGSMVGGCKKWKFLSSRFLCRVDFW